MFSGQENKRGPVKKGVNVENASRRRQDQGISLREKKREELLEKRRRQGAEGEQADPINDNGVAITDPMNPYSYDSSTNPAMIPVTLLPQFVEMVRSPQPEHQMHGVLMLRKLLAVESNPPIDEVIRTGIVPTIVEYLRRNDFTQLQFEALWVLTNIASGTQEHTQFVVASGAVPMFVELMSHPSEDIREQATWAIGNIAGDSAKCRDLILSLNVMVPLLRLLTTPTDKIPVIRNGVWTVSNLCRSKPNPDLEKVAVALPVLAHLLNHSDDEVATDACWAVSYISDGPNDRIQRVIEAGVMPRIVAMLSSPHTSMITPAIRTVGNIVTGNDEQTQVVINCGALAAMHFLLSHPKRAIRKETCWTLSNIAAGNATQIQAVLNANLIPPLMRCMGAAEFEVRKEAVWAIANATSTGTKEQIRFIVEQGVIGPLCEMLALYDVKIVAVALEAIENILVVGEDDKREGRTQRNIYADAVAENGGLDRIEQLQSHSNNDVFHNAVQILENYFEIEDTGASAPANTTASGQFAFGTPAANPGFGMQGGQQFSF